MTEIVIPWWFPSFVANGGDSMSKRQYRRWRGRMNGMSLADREAEWEKHR